MRLHYTHIYGMSAHTQLVAGLNEVANEVTSINQKLRHLLQLVNQLSDQQATTSSSSSSFSSVLPTSQPSTRALMNVLLPEARVAPVRRSTATTTVTTFNLDMLSTAQDNNTRPSQRDDQPGESGDRRSRARSRSPAVRYTPQSPEYTPPSSPVLQRMNGGRPVPRLSRRSSNSTLPMFQGLPLFRNRSEQQSAVGISDDNSNDSVGTLAPSSPRYGGRSRSPARPFAFGFGNSAGASSSNSNDGRQTSSRDDDDDDDDEEFEQWADLNQAQNVCRSCGEFQDMYGADCACFINSDTSDTN